MEIETLIRFDPYMHFGSDLLQKIYKEDQDYGLSQDVLWDISLRYPKHGYYFEDILEVRRR